MKTQTKNRLMAVIAVVSLLSIYILIFVPFGPTEGEPIDKYNTPTTALLVMDLQVDFLDSTGNMPVALHQISPMIEAANRIISHTRDLNIAPIYILNAFSRLDFIGNLIRSKAAIAGSRGANLDPRIEVMGKLQFTKRKPDAFTNGDLEDLLISKQVDHLVMTGVFADQCVRATARGAINRGYRVTVLKDAVAAASDEKREQAIEKLKLDGATIATVNQFLSRLAKR